MIALPQNREMSKNIDLFTGLHFLFGLGFAAARISYPITCITGVLYEAIEEGFVLPTGIFGKNPPIETPGNQVIDVGALMLGRFMGEEIIGWKKEVNVPQPQTLNEYLTMQPKKKTFVTLDEYLNVGG